MFFALISAPIRHARHASMLRMRLVYGRIWFAIAAEKADEGSTRSKACEQLDSGINGCINCCTRKKSRTTMSSGFQVLQERVL
ncbi:hypothetical protein [Luteimonas sp. RIT-PG2_3]